MIKHPKYIVVIGASAGGLDALAEMVACFKAGLNVAYCIVLHLSRKGLGDYVVRRLKQVSTMPFQLVVNGGAIEVNHIYIARPNQHMLVKGQRFILGGGPEENRFRPSIDVLFRSAAVSYGSNAIGIILSGLLDDGTSGMWAIKRSGGICIIQEPKEAEYPDMALSVINNMEVDYVVTLREMGNVVSTITKMKNRKKIQIPEEVIAESKIAEVTAVGIEQIEEIGDTSVFACPDCGGNLWTVRDESVKRYRCHIGHAYTEKDLVIKQAETASTTLWVALRMMEERKHLLKKMQMESAKKGYKTLIANQVKRHNEMERHIDTLKKILFDMQNHTAV